MNQRRLPGQYSTMLKAWVSFQREGAGNSGWSQETDRYIASSQVPTRPLGIPQAHVSKTQPRAYPQAQSTHLSPSFSELLFLLNDPSWWAAALRNSLLPLLNRPPSPTESFSLIDLWNPSYFPSRGHCQVQACLSFLTLLSTCPSLAPGLLPHSVSFCTKPCLLMGS